MEPITAISTLAPLVLSLFGRQGREDPTEMLQKLFQAFQGFLGGSEGQAAALGAQQGQALGQRMQSSLASLGAGGSGVGAVQQSLAQSLAGSTAQAAITRNRELVAQLAGGTLGGAMQAPFKPPSALGNLQTALGFAMLGGGNPLQDFMRALGIGGGGKSTTGQAGGAGIRQTPGMALGGGTTGSLLRGR